LNSLAQLADPATWSAMLGSGWSKSGTPEFWVAVAKIIWINVLLSGDNAVVIAMACRALPAQQRLWGMIFGAGIAVLLRIFFSGVVASLMLLPYLKITGGVALLYIAVKLLNLSDRDDGVGEAVAHLWRAVRVIAVTDVIMSLDNVIAIAVAVEGDMTLLVLGLAIGIPLIVAGAALTMALFGRFPVLVWAGAALLGWIAGEVIVTDPVVTAALTRQFGIAVAHRVEIGAAGAGAVLVLAAGNIWRHLSASTGSEV
jgi:YjbE family integral membrane protein